MMAKVKNIKGIGRVALEADTRAGGSTPAYSDAAFEMLLVDGVANEALRGVIIKEFRHHMKALASWQQRAEASEKIVAKAAREDSIYLMAKRGMSQRDISSATGLAFPAINLILKRIRQQRDGHVGTAGEPLKISTGKREYRPAYFNELKGLGFSAAELSSHEGISPSRRENYKGDVVQVRVEDPNNLPEDPDSIFDEPVADTNNDGTA